MDLFIATDWRWAIAETVAAFAAAWSIIDLVMTPIEAHRITIRKGAK